MLKGQILEFDRMINAWHRSNDANKRLDARPPRRLSDASCSWPTKQLRCSARNGGRPQCRQSQLRVQTNPSLQAAKILRLWDL
jgi:hypothetical protein